MPYLLHKKRAVTNVSCHQRPWTPPQSFLDFHTSPYAAVNLKTGITVLKSNMGIVLVAIGSLVIFGAYCYAWALAFAGVLSLNGMQADPDSDPSPLGGAMGLFFVLSFYWTHEVCKNTIRTTVAGIGGTWWFSPVEANAFCSPGIRDSLVRSTTYSLGSICFGSLIVALLQLLRNTLRNSQRDRNGGVLRCIAECVLSCIESLVE